MGGICDTKKWSIPLEVFRVFLTLGLTLFYPKIIGTNASNHFTSRVSFVDLFMLPILARYIFNGGYLGRNEEKKEKDN